jgi:lipopolysaccharide export system permease protein
MRRISISLATFTFTLMGAAFGISISRNRSNRGIFYVVGLASLYIIAYFAAKGADHLLVTTTLFYLLPHLLIVLLSVAVLFRVSKGIE